MAHIRFITARLVASIGDETASCAPSNSDKEGSSSCSHSKTQTK